MRILAFAASNSSRSINGRLVAYATRLLEDGLIADAVVEVLDINDYEMPIYSVDRQDAGGVPDLAHRFFDKIGAADALVISFAEHNGYYTAAYKNLYDWVSRIDRAVYQGKPMVLFSTSPGSRGASGVLERSVEVAERQGSDVRASLSLPSFNDNFDAETGALVSGDFDDAFRKALATLSA